MQHTVFTEVNMDVARSFFPKTLFIKANTCTNILYVRKRIVYNRHKNCNMLAKGNVLSNLKIKHVERSDSFD